MGVDNRVEAIVKALKIGLIDIEKDFEKVNKIREKIGPQFFVKSYYSLSESEIEVLNLVSFGKTNKVIADELELGQGTVRNHLSSIYEKLDVNNKIEAIEYAIQVGLLEIT